MRNSFQIKSELRGSFIITQDVIRRLVGHIEKATGNKPEISLEFASNRTISSENIDEVLEDTLIASDRIKRLSIGLFGYSQPLRANIRFLDTSSEPIQYEISGERGSSLALEEALRNEIKGIKAPYSGLNIHGHKIHLSILTSAFLGFFLYFIAHALFLNKWDKNFSLLWPLSALFMFGLPALSAWAFPGLIFDFGEGSRRSRRKRNLLYFVGSVLFGGLVLEVLGNFITARLAWN